MAVPVPWGEFDHDPRSPELASLRASDRDRELALRILSEAYADGRLARDEFDERADAVHTARTLGELPGQLADLVPTAPRGAAIAPVDHRQKAVEKYQRARREALWTFLSVSSICWMIWLLVGHDAFLWPVFPMFFTGLNAGRVVFQREDIISGEIRRREKREARALREREKRALPPGTAAGDSPESPTS